MNTEHTQGMVLLVLILNIAISAYHRHRAHAKESIPRRAEPLKIQLIRVSLSLPMMTLLAAFLLSPDLLSWSSVKLPNWAAWLGFGLGLLVAPFNLWIFRSLGHNVSETVLTKNSHQLVDQGPYRWIRHPLYTAGFLLLTALSLITMNWLLAAFTVLGLLMIQNYVIPREEANLMQKFGYRYDNYRQRSGGLWPRFPGKV